MCHFLAPVGQPEMMHKNFMRRHLRISVAPCSGMKFFCPFSAEHTANQAVGFTMKSAAFFVLKKFFEFFRSGGKKMILLAGYLLRDKTSFLVILENRIANMNRFCLKIT